MFIKINYGNSKAIKPFLTNLDMNGEYSTYYFNRFKCNFSAVYFDNIPKLCLEQLFKNGARISPLLEEWLNQNTNLTLIPGNEKYDFFDEYENPYQLKTFTKNGLKFRPSSQLGIGRVHDQKKFEEYCYSQRFLIASVVKFPVVEFRVFKGEYLLNSFPSGSISFKKHNILFP